MKTLFLIALVAMVAIQACSSASYTVKSASGDFKYEGKVLESADGLSRANQTAANARKTEAEADLTWANAALVGAYAEAIKKDPALARDVPLPNPNDSRMINRDVLKYSYSAPGTNFVPDPNDELGGYRWSPYLSAEQNARNAETGIRARYPELYRQRR